MLWMKWNLVGIAVDGAGGWLDLGDLWDLLSCLLQDVHCGHGPHDSGHWADFFFPVGDTTEK